MVTEDWRFDDMAKRLDRIERQTRYEAERGEQHVVHAEGRINGVYQMLLERTVAQLAAVAVVALVVGILSAHH